MVEQPRVTRGTSSCPNMPIGLTLAGVWSLWLGPTAVGVTGAAVLRGGYRLAGLVVLGLYGWSGFDGLGQYSRQPVAPHTLAMNLSIRFEAVAEALLLSALIGTFLNSIPESARRHDA